MDLIRSSRLTQWITGHAQHRISVGIHQVAAFVIQLQVSCPGIKDITVRVHDLEKSLSCDRHIHGPARGLQSRPAHVQVYACQLRTVAYLAGIGAASVVVAAGSAL